MDSYPATVVLLGALVCAGIVAALATSRRRERERRVAAEKRNAKLDAELASARAEADGTNELLELGLQSTGAIIFDLDMADGNLRKACPTDSGFWRSLGESSTDTTSVFDDLQTFLDGPGIHYEVERPARNEDGSPGWRRVRGTAVRDSNGKAIRFIGSVVDTTENRRTEERLRESEDRWRRLTEALPMLIWTAGADGTIDFVSAQACDYTGLSEGDMLGDGWAKAIHPAELEETGRSWSAAVAKGVGHEVEQRIRRADGEYRWFMTRALPARDATGTIFKWVASCADITKLKSLEVELRRAKDLIELGIRRSKVSIFDFDMPDGVMETARQTMFNVWETLGYDTASAPTEFVPGAVLAIHPDDIGRVRKAIQEYLDGGKGDFETEYRVRHRDGRILWRLARGQALWGADGKPTRFVGSFLDLTDRKNVEERLRESEERWKGLAETQPAIVFTTGPDGLVDYFNEWTLEYTRQPMSELVGHRWAAFIHPDDVGYTSTAWMAAIEHQRDHEVVHRIRRWDGTYRWFTTRSVAVRDADGQTVRWFGTCVDITNLKELEAELRHAKERLEVAIRSSNLSIWEYDMPGGDLTRARQTLANVWEMLGYEPDEAPLGGTMAVIHPEDLPRVIEEIRAYLAGETTFYETEHRVKSKSGAYKWLLGRGVAIRDESGTAVRFVGTSVDITDIKQIERDLEAAREAAETANRAKDEFLANVSHEIRTPMNAILGMTELALDAARSEQQKQLLSTVKSAAKNLLGIINDLLDFSKIAAGKLALDEADLFVRAEVGDTLRSLAARAHRKGLELMCHVHPDVPDALFGDAGRLRQVLMNLVGNALKFTAQGEVIVEVTRRSAPEHANVLVAFAIRDTGIGIARDKQAAIFRAFEQEDASTTRRYGGTGLGLTISAQLAALMGGAVTVESEAGRGSTFTFTARFRRSSRSELGHGPTAEVLEGLRVLVIDDNETNRRILASWLTGWRMRPTAVGDARSAFDALERGEETDTPYALVLLDSRMPDVDGVTLAGKIVDRYGSSKRLILLSSDDSPSLAASSRDAGVRAYLLKPVQQSELLETIWVVMNGVGDLRPATREGAQPVPSQHGTTLRILVAEDNELNAALLANLLGKRGYRTQFVEDGRTALKRAGEANFDLLLLDLHMPEMDGFEVVHAIREQERTTGNHLPIIALTARSSSRDRDRCLAAGMDDFLPKPIEAEALWAAIDRLVEAFPPTIPRRSRLLDARAILRSCAGEREVFDALCEVARRALPEHLERVHAALRGGDRPRLADAAHKLVGTLGAFSTIASALAQTLEDAANRDDTESSVALVSQLDALCAELLEDLRGITIDDLAL